jgi:hypothetical protein
MHLDERLIQRLRDGELAGAEEVSAREHLADCERCRTLASEIEREQEEIFVRLRELDDPAQPMMAAAEIAAMAARRDSVRAAPTPRRWIDTRLAWAAGVVIALGIVGLAYALPGSPLRAWVAALTHRGEHGTPFPGPNAPGAAPDSEFAGVSVDPGQRLLISFLGPQSRERVRIEWGASAEVEVRATRGAATFTTGAGTLQIENRDSLATFEIRIPRAAPRVEIQAQGIRIYLEEGGRVAAPQHP